ncbi:MAG: cytochrome c oxidase assembly protein [Chloroflexota bacterium]|nr:cytochrome c oxidase assembly protein [Chloroflexota bacterium]MDE2931614.1 cytochrome c oxidase assembly protein [Chloroflexota bacterium]
MVGALTSLAVGLSCGLVSLFYAIGVTRAQRLGRSTPSPWRRLSFGSGIALILVSLIGPVDTLSAQYFTMHMIQHLLLMLIAPPLLLVGAPVVMVLRGLPPFLQRPVFVTVARNRVMRRVTQTLLHSHVALGLFLATLWLWHVPQLYSSAVNDDFVHLLEHTLFFWPSVFFWWNVVDSWPFRARLSAPRRLLYIFFATAGLKLVGVLITVSGQVLYTAYLLPREGSAFAALDDQRIGGLIMWMGGGLYMLLPLAVVFFRWAQQDAAAPPPAPARRSANAVPAPQSNAHDPL